MVDLTEEVAPELDGILLLIVPAAVVVELLIFVLDQILFTLV
jgi:hypothetical protein